MRTTDDQVALSTLSIRRVSTAEQVADALRERILHGDVAPGTPLREVALAGGIGVSRNTIREAIAILANEGIVTSLPHRSAVVAELTVDDVDDVFRVREIVEIAALRAWSDGDHRRLDGVASALDEFRRAAEDGDWRRIVRADLTFHRTLVDLLDSPRISSLYHKVQSELRLCLSILSVVTREYEEALPMVEEHRRVYEALEGGRRDEAVELARRHLADNGARLRRIIAARGSTEEGS